MIWNIFIFWHLYADISCTGCFNRYYRSFDSDFAAPFVAYHVWPPLIEDGTVIVKGEVVTKKMVMVRILLKKYVKGSQWISTLFLKFKKIIF